MWPVPGSLIWKPIEAAHRWWTERQKKQVFAASFVGVSASATVGDITRYFAWDGALALIADNRADTPLTGEWYDALEAAAAALGAHAQQLSPNFPDDPRPYLRQIYETDANRTWKRRVFGVRERNHGDRFSVYAAAPPAPPAT